MKSLNSESVDIIFGEFFQKKDESKTLEILNDLDLINQFRLIRRFVELSRTPEDKAFVKKIVERTEFFKILIRKKMDPKDLKLLKNIVFQEKNLNLYEKFKGIGLEELADKIRKWLEESGVAKTGLHINPKISKNVTIFINQDDDITIKEVIFNGMSIALLQQAAPIIVTAQLFKVFLREQKKISLYSKIVIDEEWKYFKESTGDFYLLVPRLLINKVKDTSIEVLLDRLGFSKKLIEVDFVNLENEVKADPSSKVDLKKLTDFFEEKTGLWNIYLNGHGLKNYSIAHMSLADFKKFIQFLSKKLHVNFLYYSTCYGGGENLLTPFKDISTNFVIAEQATTEASSHGTLLEGRGPYRLCEHSFCVDALKVMTTPLSFTQFFNALEKYLQKIPLVDQANILPKNLSYDPWRIILNYIVPVSYGSEASDTSLIKFPGTDFFRASELGNSVKTVTEVTKRASEFEGKNIEVDRGVKALLWYPAICNVDLILHGKNSEFVFMNPEKSLHYFKNVKAEELTVDEFGKNILWGKDLKSEKIIVIKDLYLKEQKKLKDCIFFVNSLHESSYMLSVYKISDGNYSFNELVSDSKNVSCNLLVDFRNLVKNLQLSHKEKYREWVLNLLDTSVWDQPILTKNEQLVAPWQEDPVLLVLYAKKQLLGECALTPIEEYHLEKWESQEFRVGKLKGALEKKLRTPPSREKVEEQEKIAQEWTKKRDEAKKIQRQKDIEKAAKIIEAERLLMQKQKDQEKASTVTKASKNVY
ncbi:MAG: hypothetical protein UR43_C0004G0117 [candidate division TM6 bacterium GW2011_GWF2_33_332]|nr:MAG: hypothetical protein UR43_C0004G0117 [candidate division TM6 bacterium GW2011_GWF2_33_332]